ncbi:MAG: signal peptidase I [Elusimicrobia bacterium]|nr:signal peptidase I [Elusimicrobiota bacterium]
MIRRLLFLLCLGVGGGLLFRHWAFEGVYVASPSMEPTLPLGTHYFVNKMTYFFRSPKRGEIIVFEPPIKKDKELIKRVIGLPGETLSIQEKKVFLNGEPLKEHYVQYKRKDEILVGDNIAPLTVPPESYFVMGDNRDESGDSRDWKNPQTGEPIYFVHKKLIKGRLLNPLE